MDDLEMFNLYKSGFNRVEPFKCIKINNLDDFVHPKIPNGVFPEIPCATDGYVSPIQTIASQIEMTRENEILKAVQRVGIDVNKDELLKALEYDRKQYQEGFRKGYDKGYEDGVNYALGKIQELVKGGDTNGTL